jgi:hypothetical protein
MKLHKDLLPQRGFGVEIEHHQPPGTPTNFIVDALAAVGLDVDYGRSSTTQWRVNREDPDVEVKSPILRGEKGIAELQRAMNALVGIGGYVSAGAGMHVHFSRDDLTPAQLANWAWGYIRHEPQIDQIVSKMRSEEGRMYNRSNLTSIERLMSRPTLQCTCGSCARDYRERLARWQAATDAGALPTPAQWVRGDTRSPASVAACIGDINQKGPKFSIRAFPTVEIRQHQGTLNGARAGHWIRLMLALAEVAKDDGESVEIVRGTDEKTFKRFLVYTRAPLTTQNYWLVQRRLLRNANIPLTGLELTRSCPECAVKAPMLAEVA